MTIREILDGFTKEIAASKAQVSRLQELKDRVLACCRKPESADEGGSPIAGSIGCHEPRKTKKKRAA
jgi:hypothetical protein